MYNQHSACFFFSISIVILHSYKNSVVYESDPVAYFNQLIPVSTVCINAGLPFLVM